MRRRSVRTIGELVPSRWPRPSACDVSATVSSTPSGVAVEAVGEVAQQQHRGGAEGGQPEGLDVAGAGIVAEHVDDGVVPGLDGDGGGHGAPPRCGRVSTRSAGKRSDLRCPGRRVARWPRRAVERLSQIVRKQVRTGQDRSTVGASRATARSGAGRGGRADSPSAVRLRGRTTCTGRSPNVSAGWGRPNR